MVVSCRLELLLPEGSSLKDKRRLVRSLVERSRRRFNVAVAEVDALDAWRRAVLGLACVSNQHSHARAMLEEVVRWFEGHAPGEAIVSDFSVV